MKKLTIYYDNWCPNCTRFSNFVKRYDWFYLIKIEKLREQKDKKEDLNLDLATKKMASQIKQKWYYGYISLYFIFCRLPLFWVLFPLFWLLKISSVGDVLYNFLAVNRKIIPLHCDEECKI